MQVSNDHDDANYGNVIIPVLLAMSSCSWPWWRWLWECHHASPYNIVYVSNQLYAVLMFIKPMLMFFKPTMLLIKPIVHSVDIDQPSCIQCWYLSNPLVCSVDVYQSKLYTGARRSTGWSFWDKESDGILHVCLNFFSFFRHFNLTMLYSDYCTYVF